MLRLWTESSPDADTMLRPPDERGNNQAEVVAKEGRRDSGESPGLGSSYTIAGRLQPAVRQQIKRVGPRGCDCVRGGCGISEWACSVLDGVKGSVLDSGTLMLFDNVD